MNHLLRLIPLASFAFAAAASDADWNQWRGPNRNGVLPVGPKLADVWSSDGPRQLWESDPIPANDLGGHGSAVVAGDKVYMSVVWHEDIPSDTRVIDDLVMRKLGARGVDSLGADLVRELDETVLNLSPRLRGDKLQETAEKWVEEHLDKKQKLSLADYIISRFKKGRKNIPFADFAKLEQIQGKVFPDDAAFRAWVDTQGFSEFVKGEVVRAVPPTKRVAQDTIVCLSLQTGKILWKAAAPGEPKGRNCSSTPAVAEGHVYGIGSTHLYCVNAETGKIVWSTPVKRKGVGSSPLVIDGIVVVHANDVTAYDAKTGALRWEHPKLRVTNSSATAWHKDGRTFIISNTRDSLVAMNPADGEIQWTLAAGGDCTPAIQGDYLAVQSNSDKLGFMGFKLDVKEPRKLWNIPFLARRTQASPIIVGDLVYLIDDSTARCVELQTGKPVWKQKVQSSITSPVMADGKFYVITDRGNNLTMFRPDSKELTELGKHRVKALSCPSPSVAGGYMLLRQEDKLVCYDITEGQQLAN